MTERSIGFQNPLVRSGWRAWSEPLSLPAILGFAILAIAWVLPGHYLPWTMFQQELLAAAAGLLLCWAALEKAPSVVWPASALVALAMAAVPWLQLGTGQIRFLTDALLASTYLVAFGLAVCVGTTMAAGPRRGQLLEGLTASFVAAAVVSSGIALYQWLQLPPVGDWVAQLPPGGRAFANLSQPNHLSSLLALGIAGILRWYETRRIDAWVAGLAIAWLGWGIVMTQSRTGWLFIGTLFVWWLVAHRRAELRLSPIALIAGTTGFTVLVSLHGWLMALWAMDDGASAAVRLTAGTRMIHWRSLWDAALQSPWLGYGWNQVSPAQLAVAIEHPASGEMLMYSHNLFLDLLLYNGLPLGLLMGGALVFWMARQAARTSSADAWCLMLALFALFGHAMVEYPLHYLYFLLPTGLMMGALEALPSARPATVIVGRRATLWLPAVLMAGALASIGIEYVRAEEALRRLRFASARIGITLADLVEPDLTLLDGWRAYHQAATTKIRAGMSIEELSLVSDVATRFPYPAALSRHAHALTLNGKPADARRALQYFCKLYPEGVQTVMRENWAELGDRDPAVRIVSFPRCSE